MSNVEGNPNESWRAVNGFWGKVVAKIGSKNKILLRKNLYVRWLEDRKGLRSSYERIVYNNGSDTVEEVTTNDVS